MAGQVWKRIFFGNAGGVPMQARDTAPSDTDRAADRLTEWEVARQDYAMFGFPFYWR